MTSAAPGSLPEAVRRHWREYACEGGLLGGFMVVACLVAVAADHPASPLRLALADPWARRALGGLAMGTTAVGIIYSPWGRRSGAHINPATTLTFYTLGRVAPWDAALYAAAQFVGGAAGVALSALLLGGLLADPAVHYAVTRPGMPGLAVAFAAEAAMTGVLMTVVLRTAASPRLARYTGLCVGALVATYITVEAPLSGMSMNPARTFASAVVARDWTALWLYFLAPPLGMLTAAQAFVATRRAAAVPCAKLRHAEPCLFCAYWRPRVSEAEGEARVGTQFARRSLQPPLA